MTDLSPRAAPASPSFGELHRTLRQHPGDRATLQRLAQMALQVEFATIPVYLTGMYSIADTASAAYQTLRSVVIEEMFHLNLAANLVVGLGALPKFSGSAAPVYPGPMPGANPATTPMIGLFRASPAVFSNVYAAIERPAPPDAPAQDDHFDTIAQLYLALRDGILQSPEDPFQHPGGEGRQRTDIYIGAFGGETRPIVDRDAALFAIQQIVQQGEGVITRNGQPMDSTEPFGAYNHYGRRSDGTYGPILGTPLELSHFIKFREISLSQSPFPATLPMTSNPDASQFTNPEAQRLAATFDEAYSLMLHAFERAFMAGGGDPYFSVVLNLMHAVLPSLAVQLMSTPAHVGGDSKVGPNAAPCWRYREG
ncbi:ferritin-like domain-containing protein, partial [Mitsuaria sp. GD03876]|uniref:ferritin-like domain-containing protein n=1 Tax=Mitsuaria sp. GD03876 TaxID=2975399 RepID=UPI00244730BC